MYSNVVGNIRPCVIRKLYGASCVDQHRERTADEPENGVARSVVGIIWMKSSKRLSRYYLDYVLSIDKMKTSHLIFVSYDIIAEEIKDN